MKVNPAIPNILNLLLAGELTAIHQYVVHAKIQEQWGYPVLAEVEMKRAQSEMAHADKLMERIIFLEGIPNVERLDPLSIGQAIPDQITNDIALEHDAIAKYNEAIKVIGADGDNDTRVLLESILKDETQHIDYLEGEIDRINQMGVQIFLSTCTKTE